MLGFCRVESQVPSSRWGPSYVLMSLSFQVKKKTHTTEIPPTFFSTADALHLVDSLWGAMLCGRSVVSFASWCGIFCRKYICVWGEPQLFHHLGGGILWVDITWRDPSYGGHRYDEIGLLAVALTSMSTSLSGLLNGYAYFQALRLGNSYMEYKRIWARPMSISWALLWLLVFSQAQSHVKMLPFLGLYGLSCKTSPLCCSGVRTMFCIKPW